MICAKSGIPLLTFTSPSVISNIGNTYATPKEDASNAISGDFGKYFRGGVGREELGVFLTISGRAGAHCHLMFNFDRLFIRVKFFVYCNT